MVWHKALYWVHFLLFINDIYVADDLIGIARLFADDTFSHFFYSTFSKIRSSSERRSQEIGICAKIFSDYGIVQVATCNQSMKGGKGQESIQSSTTTDPEYRMGK